MHICNIGDVLIRGINISSTISLTDKIEWKKFISFASAIMISLVCNNYMENQLFSNSVLYLPAENGMKNTYENQLLSNVSNLNILY